MSNMKKISVIMGIYNCEDTLREAVDSIIGQTYSNWELIMCNDASTDNTLEIAKDYSRYDKRIKVIENKINKGLAYSLNRCLELAKGEYIARHDGDDICLPERFEKQIKFIEENNYDFIGGYAKCFDDNGIWGEIKTKNHPNKIDIFTKPMFVHPTIMIKKSFLRAVGGYTVSTITYRTEDYDLYGKLYEKGYTGHNLRENLILFRRNKDAYKRMKFKFRIDETKCKFIIWKRLNIGVRYIPYVISPLIKGLIPIELLKKYHKVKFSKINSKGYSN